MREYAKLFEKLSSSQNYQTLFEAICSFSNRVAAEYADERDTIRKITYAQYEQKIRAAAPVLSALLEKRSGVYVGLKMRNCPDWPTAFWSILLSGNHPLLLDAEGTPVSTGRLLTQAGAAALICDQYEEHAGIRCFTPADIFVPSIGEACDAPFGDRVALCTSGTVESAKIFVFDGRAMARQIENAKEFFSQSRDLIYEQRRGELKNLAFLPLHHIFGFVAVYMWYSCGGKVIVYLRDKSPSTIMRACIAHRVTHLFCVPLFWNNVAAGVMKRALQGGPALTRRFERLCRLSLRLQKGMPTAGRKLVSSLIFRKVQKNLFGTSIRFLINGGGHILPESLRIINLLGYPLYSGFGMTETGITSVEMSPRIQDRLNGSVGMAFRSVSYSIEGGEDGTGELVITGSSIYSAQLADGRSIPRKHDGFNSGDIGRLESGRLFIEGRLKDVIIGESGENIYPDEMEDYFSGLTGVVHYCILGLRGGSAYEMMALVIEPDAGTDEASIPRIADQVNAINRALPFSRKVRMVLAAQEPIPMALGVKVQRQKLRRLIEEGGFRYSMLDLSEKHLAARNYREESLIIQNDLRYVMLRDDVRRIFADVLGLKQENIGDQDHFFHDLGGDSLTIIGLMTKMEDTYCISMPFSELSTLAVVNVNEITELTYHKLYGSSFSSAAEQEEIIAGLH
jgi:acyl carrier protein